MLSGSGAIFFFFLTLLVRLLELEEADEPALLGADSSLASSHVASSPSSKRYGERGGG